jgi:hypothetical protein
MRGNVFAIAEEAEMTEYRVRPLASADLPDLIEIERSCFADGAPGALGSARLRSFCDHARATSRVLELDGVPVGFALSVCRGREAFVLSAAIKPEHTTAAAMTCLLEGMLIAVAHRADSVVLSAERSSLASHALELVLDAKVIGAQPAYFGAGRDALLLAIEPAAFCRARSRLQGLGKLSPPMEVTDPELLRPPAPVGRRRAVRSRRSVALAAARR